MGFALAEGAHSRGAAVTLVTGPVSLPSPQGVRRIDVESAEEMLRACQKEFKSADIFIATAAVGDYAPETKAERKIKKSGKAFKLKLKPNPDILQILSQKKGRDQIVVGFAAETHDVLRHAREKLKKKNLNFIVANDVSKKDRGFGSEQNIVVLLDQKGKTEKLGLMSKRQVAEGIFDKIERLLNLKHR